MTYNAELYIHELDRKTFNALNKFPKLIKLIENYNANYSEKMAKLDLLSNAIRLSEDQMPEVYNLLPPVCEKLGIDVPELYYVDDNKNMNAGTFGSVNPVMYVTSGLVNKIPNELLSSVFAHECGHIACKHTLYHSIAAQLIDGIEKSPLSAIPAIRNYLDPALVRALLFWDRCSELSADRAAVLCDESPDKTIDVLLRINGYNRNINRDEFLKQALDLEEFVKDSKSNALIEQMLIQGESHPRLATRVYECYEWSKSNRFVDILNGTIDEGTSNTNEEEIETREIVQANVEVKSQNNIDTTTIDERLSVVNNELEKYTCEQDKAYYALAIGCGIISGAVDALFIGESKIDKGAAHKKVNEFVQGFAKKNGFKGERLKDAVGFLEKRFPVAQDNIWKGANIGVTSHDHHLADLAHHPTPAGLASAIIVQFLKISIFVNDKGEWHFENVGKINKNDIVNLLVPTVITGLLNWLVSISNKKVEEGIEMPEILIKLSKLIAHTPQIAMIADCAETWFGHLVSDMGGSKSTAGGGKGIPGVIQSLAYEIASLPMLKNTGLIGVLDDIYQKQGFDLREELAYVKVLDDQLYSVALNDICTRVAYFTYKLCEEVDHNGIENVNWRKVLPFGNRTVDRMLMISSTTFMVADTADAAVRAAIESNGNWALFAGRFVSRFNYVGAGKAALSIVKEISNEDKECQLIHEKMLLTHIKTEQILKEYQEYKVKLDEKLAQYFAEDIETFMSGINDMKDGINNNDSDLVISGNVKIQKILGRKPQFTNQKEFDDLMGSDTALKL